MREIKFIAIHCTATPSNYPVESIIKYWKTILKWNSPGYHWIIKAEGDRIQLIPEQMISNGVAGYNHEIINVAYIGGTPSKGVNKDTRTEQQKISMLILLKELKERYPNAIIQGHRDFPNVHKDCPCFNAIPEYKNI